MLALIALGNLARTRVHRLHAPMTMIMNAQATAVPEKTRAEPIPVRTGAASRKTSTRHTDTGTGTGGPADDQAQLGADQAAITLTRLRWGVGAEVLIAASVLAVTAVLVNTPTARETYTPPATAVAVFNTGGPQGTGRITIVMTPDQLGPNQFRFSVTNDNGHPFRPAQIQAALALPQRNLGPLAIKLTTQKPGTYLSAPVIVTITGQWQLRITIRTDPFDETTVTVPVGVH